VTYTHKYQPHDSSEAKLSRFILHKQQGKSFGVVHAGDACRPNFKRLGNRLFAA
jgi:hypothetical protein